MTSTSRATAAGFLLAGLDPSLVAFVLQVAADAQKRRFRRRPDNANRFIRSGLASWPQQPICPGRIVLPRSVAVAAFHGLRCWRYATLVSPVLVRLLLTRISGVRMLGAVARVRGRADPGDADASARTPTLVPCIPPRR